MDQPTQKNVHRRATSDIAILPALAMAVPLYGITVLAAKAMPRYVRELLLERGWVTHVIVLLTYVALAILVLKTIALVKQRRAFALDILPTNGGTITPDAASAMIDHVDEQRLRFGGPRKTRSFLIERVSRVLHHFAARGDVSETATAQGTDSDADASGVASSFSIVKVLVWAMPILGFIGTVIGISEAMAGFSKSLEGAAEFDSVKSSLGNVTTGLALAFDTTLVALVASILVMLPMSWLAKAEERLIEDVDDYCVTNLLRRLVGPETQAAEASASAVAPSAALVQAEESAVALRQFIVDTLAPSFSEMLSANAKLMTRLTEDREALTASQTLLAEQLTAFAASAATLAPAVERGAAELGRATALLDQSTTLADRSAAAVGRAQDQLCRELGASRQLLQLLAAGLGGGSASPSPAPEARSANGHHANGREIAE
jgi:biopolymer transport protein ExbB/TolQ